LHAVDSVDAVEEEDENEDEGDLVLCQALGRLFSWKLCYTFIAYCILATIGLSEMKLNNFRLAVNGMGIIRATNSSISKTRRTNT